MMCDNCTLSSVRIGEWNLETTVDIEDGSEAPPVINAVVAETIVHESFRNNDKYYHFDIALLRLQNKIKFSEFVSPICLPLDPSLWEEDYTGRRFHIVGWGRSILRAILNNNNLNSSTGQTENETQSAIKQQLSIPFVPKKQCATAYKIRASKFPNSQVGWLSLNEYLH